MLKWISKETTLGIICVYCLISCGGTIGSTPSNAAVPIKPRFYNLGAMKFEPELTFPNAGSHLKAFKIYPININLCKSIRKKGQSFVKADLCSILYESKNQDLANLGPNDFQKPEIQDSLLDLMDAGSIDRFQSGIQGTLVQESYNYVTMNLAPFVLIEGSFVGSNTVACQISGSVCIAPSSLQGASKAVVLPLPTSSVWFPLQKPLVIERNDVERQRVYFLDLFFDPYASLVAQETSKTLGVSSLEFAPLARLSTDLVRLDLYLGDLPDGQGQIRLELFNRKSDELSAFMGINFFGIALNQTQSLATLLSNSSSKITNIETDALGLWNFKNDSDEWILKGLKAQTSSLVSVQSMLGLSTTTLVNLKFMGSFEPLTLSK